MRTKKEVNYRHGKWFWKCQNCSMFKPPHGCTLVEGWIQKQDVCNEWEPKWLMWPASE